MSKSVLWTSLTFVVFAFAAMMIFFWVRDGSLEDAGASMDRTLSNAGSEVSAATSDVIDATSTVIDNATDGDDRT